jgi:inhibitor of KinA sporulation pathway (predicted exonuclease)
MNRGTGMKQEDIDRALHLFGLTEPFTREQLEERRRELLATWHPPRYATLTNNPRKYMQMYKKGEAMTKDIESAYQVLSAWLSSREQL